MKRLFLIVCVFFIACRPSFSQSIDKNGPPITQGSKFKDAEKLISKFFGKYKSEGPINALDYFFSTNSSTDKNQLAALKNKLDSANNLFGTFTGTEKIVQKDVSGSLVLFSYLVKYDMAPIRFTFILYKPGDKWMLYKFLYDSEVVTELEDSAKIYIIK